jgi:arylsulfatase A-like enzyme
MNRCARTCLALVVLTALQGERSSGAESDKPNVLVIVGDDMGYGDISVHGCRDIPTPHIDSLATSGVRCTSGYVSGPYCSPTRAGLLTGRYQTRFGHEFNPGGGRRRNQPRADGQRAGGRRRGRAGGQSPDFGLPVLETTIADRMKSAGYATGLVGKWHLGGAPMFHPQRRGFDEFYGFLSGAHSYRPGEGGPILRGDEPADEKEYLTDALAREAVSFIDRHREQPFFLDLSFNAVHTPMHATKDRLEEFKDIEDEHRRKYAAMMSAMDDAIGEVLAKLEESGLEENTLVFFFSDNGGPTMPGTTGNGSVNAPLRGSKRTTLEGGVRVPYMVKWPARLPAGKVYHKPVIQLDVLPTALAAAGAEIPANADGVDLVPYLRGEKPDAPHDALYWRLGKQMAVREGDWKLVRYDTAVEGTPGAVSEAKLYNLADDIGEQNDLASEQPEKAEALEAKWDEWNESNVAPLWGGRGARLRAAR